MFSFRLLTDACQAPCLSPWPCRQCLWTHSCFLPTTTRRHRCTAPARARFLVWQVLTELELMLLEEDLLAHVPNRALPQCFLHHVCVLHLDCLLESDHDRDLLTRVHPMRQDVRDLWFKKKVVGMFGTSLRFTKMYNITNRRLGKKALDQSHRRSWVMVPVSVVDIVFRGFRVRGNGVVSAIFVLSLVVSFVVSVVASASTSHGEEERGREERDVVPRMRRLGSCGVQSYVVVVVSRNGSTIP